MQLASAFTNIQTFLSAESVASSSNDSYSSSGSSFNRKKMRRFFRNSNMLPFILVGIAILEMVRGPTIQQIQPTIIQTIPLKTITQL
jgi:hypothetical protein